MYGVLFGGGGVVSEIPFPRSDLAIRFIVKSHQAPDHLEGPQFGFLGSPRVSVLVLNLALDETKEQESGVRSRSQEMATVLRANRPPACCTRSYPFLTSDF